ncbi:HMG-box domain-containing protein [Aspergillus fischeri NRRL 181]|uniref:HMG box protein, putative n=1 Tax=Neosartorya fischeri (strain ATCC 1020 / DSM 3700 / CBS 544.65 / FGSC A1164 / JCM 1740 / NRRL 181 / WB 181) TaxID=331117 RepID=A1DA50_NEOFI|nr:HMG box protein, putative [Aspergillus fischeri NRRL 181]EAW20681.1 HMG box protein, putative [Aspergillus fischeri NRRL 181]
MAAAAATARFIQSPSPPQSTNGDPASEQMLNSLDCSQNPFITYRLTCSAKAAYSELKPQAMTYGPSSSPRYVSHHEYPTPPPLQHSMLPSAIQVNTAPPAADDGVVPSKLKATPPRWPSSSALKLSPGEVRVAKTPRIRRRAKKASNRESKPKLPGPLSRVTKHLTHVPLRDMDSWVRRPREVRHKEVARKNGKVARPMNSFMLYRSAYAERTKEWVAQNNHQVVSKVAGDSWRIETPEIREKYELLANMEKANHLKAHPGYKFSPSKEKKKRSETDDDQLTVDGGEMTSGSSPTFLQVRAAGSSEVDSNGWASRDSTPINFPEHGLLTTTYYGSSWQTSHHSKDMLSPPRPSPYLQQSMHHNLMGHPTEDPRFKHVGLQDIPFTSSTVLAGLPGAAHHNLLQPQNTPGTGPNGQLDPQLLSLSDHSSQHAMYSQPHYAIWQEVPTSNCYVPVPSPLPSTYHVGATYNQGMQTLGDSRDTWDSADNETSLDASNGEFEHWINSQASGYSC